MEEYKMYQLNGIYYTAFETAKAANISHSILLRCVKKSGMTPLRIGNNILFTEAEHEEILKFVDDYGNQDGMVNVKQAAARLGINLLAMRELCDSGMPFVLNEKGQKRFSVKNIVKLRESEEWKASWENSVKKVFG
jgi:hypothetical protein